MVLGRNDKRKRKEGDLVDLMDPLTESPKRTKIHAQRKFAQGATTPFIPAMSPIKEKEKVKTSVIAELITHKRPNTEDFLTFLCYRGTSILPPNLNFFNAGNRKEKSRTQTTSSGDGPKTIKGKPSIGTKKVVNKLSNRVEKKILAKTTIQALKKKYQEQRLAKERIKHKLKTPTLMTTRSRTEKTIPRKFVARVEIRRHGLRSGSTTQQSQRSKKLINKTKPKNKLIRKDKTSDEESYDFPASKKQIDRRITRSHRENRQIPTIGLGASVRPSRKTKEAAAVYMEILGRKLISPDLDNDDSLSVDSFPELPNARKIAETENLLKNQQQANKKLIKPKPPSKPNNDQLVMKNKRIIRKIQRYRESESESDESNSDEQSTSSLENTRRVTRNKPTIRIPRPSIRSLRSSSRTLPQKDSKSMFKNKYLVKRKQGKNDSSMKLSNETIESEEETLGTLLDRMKKNKSTETTKPIEKPSDDDEGSFRGFSKKLLEASSQTVIDVPPRPVRKEKVNMSTEQIEKWLTESSLLKEESKLEMETVSPTSHLSISNKIQHLVRPVNVTLSKLTDKAGHLKKLNEDSKSLEKKALTNNNCRKPFLPKVKERKTTTPNANAFSPENESSVYAFESDTETPVSTPFRRKIRERSSNETQTSPSNGNNAQSKSENEVYELSKSFSNLTNVQVLPLNNLTTNWSDVGCSNSIAVQVNLDEQPSGTVPSDPPSFHSTLNLDKINILKSSEISTQTETNNEQEDDNNAQLFYIPLQAVTRTGQNLIQGQQYIQGVAVKLGTEGPTGPNQKVLLRAKLVTKPPVSVARCPPVGTVQPTTRIPPTDQPSTSFVREAESLPPTQVSNRRTPCERKSSSDSIKIPKKTQIKSKQKVIESHASSNSMVFSNTKNEEIRLVEAPTFHPTEKDFQDPLEYIDKIRPIAEKFGICRVVPPSNFKPECKVSDDMRFTAYNQYVHRMLHRWGPNVKEMMAIKMYLATQSISLTHPPWIGGMEVDLPHLYQTVQSLGGLKEVIEKKKWQKVADGMKIPKTAQDRVTKLDDIYCKYLLPYDTLSQEEREKLFDEVELEWKKREDKVLEELQESKETTNDTEDEEEEDESEEIDECIVKGRNMALNAFYRIARNTQRMWFGDNQKSGNEAEGALALEVESAFWKHVAERKRHVCVHAASIDSSGRGFGFSVAKNSPFARHPWNLKVLTNNAGSVLKALGPIMGVTVPTLHVGMLFSACCWYRDPHGLPWIEYLHTGAKKIWYGIPDEHNDSFRRALSTMVPRYCKNKTIWLPSDTAMVPPEMLVDNGVPLCQTVQEPGQFIIVFPKAFTSSICTGYVVSESVYFAQSSWLDTAEQVFKDIQDSCEPSIFSLEKLLFNIIHDSRSHVEVLKQILPIVNQILIRENQDREQLEDLGLTNSERLPLPDSGRGKKGRKVKEDDGDFECEICRANLYVALVNNSQDETVYCLSHAVQLLSKKKQILKHCTLMYTYTKDELDDLVRKLEDRIQAKSKKANQPKSMK